MTVQIWFEFASTYSYLTVHRAPSLLKAQRVDFTWRPFLLGPIFREKGLDTSPFVVDPTKGRYMWRDVERRAQRFGLPFARPPIFPMNGLKAARIMTSALQEPWCGAFAQAVFREQFERGADISENIVLCRALESVGQNAQIWIQRSQDTTTKEALYDLTNEARALGIFGAPSFIVGNELFWGDDRLEDAIAFARDARRRDF